MKIESPNTAVFNGYADTFRKLGTARDHLDRDFDVGDWTPQKLTELGWATLEQAPPAYKGVPEKFARKHFFARQRAGVVFIVGAETPLRSKNWRYMRWGENLYFNGEVWHVRFKGEELKVGMRSGRINIYEFDYSGSASAAIDLHRETLREFFGSNFEKECPFVFPSLSYVKPSPEESERPPKVITNNNFNACLKKLVLEHEESAEGFSSHFLRHIVATYLVNEFGKGGIALAAARLGDTVEMIMERYFKPNNDSANQRYLDELARK